MLLHVLDAQNVRPSAQVGPPQRVRLVAAKMRCATSELLLANVVIERIGAKDSALRAANDPFLTIGVITRLAHGIIGYYVPFPNLDLRH